MRGCPPLSLALVAAALLLAARAHDLAVGCDSSSCNIRLGQYYNELGCEAVRATNSCCPATFDCSALRNRSTEECFYRGHVFQPGDHLPRGASPNPCIVDCVCRREADGLARFTCVSSECPDVFGPPLPPGCVRLYQLDQCCDVGTYCDDSDQPAPFQCEHQGKTYVEGQYIYSEGFHCKSCICQKGFNGTLDGPWCRDLSCDMELHHSHWLQQGCAPVFYGEEVCCPIDWRCPADTDTVISPESTSTEILNATEVNATSESPTDATLVDQGVQCEFGHVQLPVGASLSAGDNPCVQCACHTPPHVSCQQTPHALCSRRATEPTTPLSHPATTTTN